MKKTLLVLLLVCATLPAPARKQAESPAPEGYRFTLTDTLPATAVKDQSRSGTCWCFSGLALIESEILRNGGPEVDLSEMWIVRHALREKAEKYVRMHGNLTFGQGGAAHDVLNGLNRYGIVPEAVYPGLQYGTQNHEHNEVDAALKGYLDGVIAQEKSPRFKGLTYGWLKGVDAILDAYFGPLPEHFTVDGKDYTPLTYLRSLPVELDDYVSLTSFTHHPFYTPFIVEVPDNWAWYPSYNLPLNELMATLDAALDTGYTVCWSTDVSEKGFSRTRAIGIVPVEEPAGIDGTDAERWGKLTAAEKDSLIYRFDIPVPEQTVTEATRQQAFDNYRTTDDHGMQIVGRALDQQGHPFFYVKNSWNRVGPFNGYFYFSRPFVELKTISLMLNRKAIPEAIRRKLGL